MKKNRHARNRDKLKNAVRDKLNGGADPNDPNWKDYTKLIGTDYTIEGAWLSFRASVIPPDAGRMQVHETRKAFLAGWNEGFKVLTDFAAGLDEDAACRFLSKLADENDRLVHRLIHGDWA